MTVSTVDNLVELSTKITTWTSVSYKKIFYFARHFRQYFDSCQCQTQHWLSGGKRHQQQLLYESDFIEIFGFIFNALYLNNLLPIPNVKMGYSFICIHGAPSYGVDFSSIICFSIRNDGMRFWCSFSLKNIHNLKVDRQSNFFLLIVKTGVTKTMIKTRGKPNLNCL